VSSENLTLEIFCSGLKNRAFINMNVHPIIKRMKKNHRDKMLFSFLLILNSGTDTHDLFSIFLNGCLRFLRENGF
jgi:hypothetical protein